MSTSPYVAETIAMVGDRNPLEILQGMPGWLESHLEDLTPEQWRKPEGRDKWSLVEVAAHLADAEIAQGFRARQILTAEQPPLPGYDQLAWLKRFDYCAAEPAMALDTFLTLRRWNLRIWERVTREDLQRIGVHAERGIESLDVVMRLTAGHDLRHQRQILRLLNVVR